MQFYRNSLLCFFLFGQSWSPLAFFSLNLFPLNFCLSQFQVFQWHVRPRGAFIFQSSLSDGRYFWRIVIVMDLSSVSNYHCQVMEYFCLLWAHLRPLQQRAGALQSPCFHITGSQSCWLKKDPFSNNCVEGEKDPFPLSLFAKKIQVSIWSLPQE